MESRDIINLSTLAESKKKKRGCDPFSSFLHLLPPFILRCILLPTRGIIICKSNSSVTTSNSNFDCQDEISYSLSTTFQSGR